LAKKIPIIVVDMMAAESGSFQNSGKGWGSHLAKEENARDKPTAQNLGDYTEAGRRKRPM